MGGGRKWWASHCISMHSTYTVHIWYSVRADDSDHSWVLSGRLSGTLLTIFLSFYMGSLMTLCVFCIFSLLSFLLSGDYDFAFV